MANTPTKLSPSLFPNNSTFMNSFTKSQQWTKEK